VTIKLCLSGSVERARDKTFAPKTTAIAFNVRSLMSCAVCAKAQSFDRSQNTAWLFGVFFFIKEYLEFTVRARHS